MESSFLLALVIYLINGLIFGFITLHVAQSKGYDKGFAWGFFLGLIGLLVVGFRPDIRTTSPAQSNPSDGARLAALTHTNVGNTWGCVCGHRNPYAVSYCLRCRRNRKDTVSVKRITCPHCDAKNKETNTLCFACNKPLKTNIQPAENVSKAAGVNLTSEHLASYTEILEALAKLKDQGVLTDDEYTQKKTEILNKIQ